MTPVYAKVILRDLEMDDVNRWIRDIKMAVLDKCETCHEPNKLSLAVSI